MTPPIIEEGPFTLRLPRAEDVSWIFHACQDEDIQRFTMVPSPYTPADAIAWVSTAASLCADGTELHFLVSLTETGELVGSAGLCLQGDGQGEIGYWVERDSRRMGVATAAIGALERYGVEVLRLSEISLRIAEENVASQRVAASRGYQPVGPDADLCNGMVALRYTKQLDQAPASD